MKKLLIVGTIYTIALTIFPEILTATTSTKFGGAEITEHGNSLSDWLFGPVGMIAAVAGGGYSMCTSYMSGSPKPLVAFVGIGLIGCLIPTFIGKIHTLLLP